MHRILVFTVDTVSTLVRLARNEIVCGVITVNLACSESRLERK